MKSSVVYAAWCAFVRFDQVWYKLTELLKKAFRHFLTANRKKTFRRIFSFNFGCKKKTLRDFFASRSSLKNSKYQDAGLKHKLKSASRCGVYCFRRWTPRSKNIAQSFLSTAKFITTYPSERFLSISGEQIYLKAF